MQTRLFDRHSEVSKVTASKSKQENSSNPHSQPNQVSEQDSGREAEEIFDVEAAMKRRNEEREFKREFAKDLRKLEKVNKSNNN